MTALDEIAPALLGAEYLIAEVEARHGLTLDAYREGWIERNGKDWWDLDDHERNWADARDQLALRVARTAHQVLGRFPAGYRGATLDDLTTTQEPDAIRRWLADPDAKTLVLAGKPGTGKTHAAYAALREHTLQTALDSVTAPAHWRSTRAPAAMGLSLAGLLDALRRDPDGDLWEHAKATSLLLLDDLAAVRVTDWSVERHWILADARCSNDRRTIVTTNAPHASLAEAWGPPTMDRWRDRCVVLTVTGESRRQPAW